jgi:hypothetical protein
MPFFILANPRSGSSMFRLMLNAHSNVTVPPESGFALWYAEKYSELDVYNQKVYASFVDDVLQAKKFETWGVTRDQLFEKISEVKPHSYIGMVDTVYQTYAFAHGKCAKVFGDKNNYYVAHIDSIQKVFPNSKMVFLFRDGRDVAVSYKNIDQEKIKSDYVPKLDKNIGSIATEWANNVQNFLRVMDQDKETIAVKYEDLLTNPENELCRVFNFLGEEFEGQTLNFHQFNDEPKEFLQWKSKTLEGVDDKNMNKYKTYLTDEEITEFNEIAKEQLLTLGYEV